MTYYPKTGVRAKDQPTDWTKVEPGTPVEVQRSHGGWVGDFVFVACHGPFVIAARDNETPIGRHTEVVRLAP